MMAEPIKRPDVHICTSKALQSASYHKQCKLKYLQLWRNYMSY